MFRLFVILGALVLLSLPSPQPHVPMPEPDPAADAWSVEALDKAVAGPVSAWTADGRGEGDVRFEALVRAAHLNGEEQVRLLTAYGMAIFARDKAASLTYLKRAAIQARKAFGPDSRQLAMALADYATVEYETLGDRASPEAELMAKEAHSIRLRTLGLRHFETLASQSTLRRFEELPSRINGDPEKLALVSRRYEAALAPRLDQNLEPWDRERIADRWISVLIANRRPDLACELLVQLQSKPVGEFHEFGNPALGQEVGEQLKRAGYAREAAPLLIPTAQPDAVRKINWPPSIARCG